MDIIINEIENDLSNNVSLENISKKLNIKLNKSELVDKKKFLNKNNKDLPEIYSNKIFYQNVFNKKVDGPVKNKLIPIVYYLLLYFNYLLLIYV